METFSIAAAVVQFIDVACKVVSNIASIRRSADGQLDETREIEQITQVLSRDARNIQRCIENRRKTSDLMDTEKEQEKIGEGCQEVDPQLYRITGKPGSGKSTLTKYLRQSSDTFAYLKSWTGDSRLVYSHFYFWNSGSDI